MTGMTRVSFIFSLLGVVALGAGPEQAGGASGLERVGNNPHVGVTVASALDAARPQQTVELAWRDVAARLPEVRPESVAVLDEAAGNWVTSQVLDDNGDGQPDWLLFQANFLPRQTRSFIVAAGVDRRQLPAPTVTTTARLAPEHADDFAWESDRIAFRIYSHKLWKQTPGGTGSGVDVWCKHKREPVVEHLYHRNYHEDDGFGVDAYNVGTSRGCGGTAIWANERLWGSRCFDSWKLLAAGPIRTVFELTYDKWDAAGRQVGEVKRISLDLGSNFNRFDCRFVADGTAPLTVAAGVQLHGGAQLEQAGDWAAAWEKADGKNNGQIGLAVIAPGGTYRKAAGHALFLQSVAPGGVVTFHAGAGWSKGLDYPDQAAWTASVSNWAARLKSPLQVQFKKHEKVAGPGADWFGAWPQGKDPAAIGRRLSEEFLAREQPHNRGFIYPEVITWNGSLMLSRLIGATNLNESLIRKLDFFLTPEGDKRLNKGPDVDTRVFGSLALEIYLQTRDERYLTLGKFFADAQWRKPSADGLTREARYWVDDIYMISILQTQAYRATGDPVYLDRCARTATAYLAKLQQPNGLFFHSADSPCHWGRGNGWFAAGMTEILRVLPAGHPERPAIMAGYRKMMKSLLAYQGASGLWKQLVDKPEAWDESSCSGMFAYALVTGIKEGWLDGATYGPAARKAWLALADCINGKNQVRDICGGTYTAFSQGCTSPEAQYTYYLKRPRSSGDLHGQAPVLWTACALLRPGGVAR